MRAVAWPLLVARTAALVVIEQTLHGRHRPPPRAPHAEVPARLDAAAAALHSAPFAEKLTWRAAGECVSAEAAEAAVESVHTMDHIVAVRRMSQTGGGFDADTYCAPGSWEAMLDGTAAWLEASRLAAAGDGPALALARPPGHHATRGQAMGFCLVNFAAAAACAHLEKHPDGKVSRGKTRYRQTITPCPALILAPGAGLHPRLGRAPRQRRLRYPRQRPQCPLLLAPRARNNSTTPTQSCALSLASV